MLTRILVTNGAAVMICGDQIGPDATERLYHLVDAAYEKRSIAISSNLHPAGLTS